MFQEALHCKKKVIQTSLIFWDAIENVAGLHAREHFLFVSSSPPPVNPDTPAIRADLVCSSSLKRTASAAQKCFLCQSSMH